MSPCCRDVVEVIKSPSSTTTTTSWISNSSSPSSTLSDSSNCPFAVATRKPRTPRKRPNQTYNEAAAILSTAYPKVFPTKPSNLANSNYDHTTFLLEPSELLMPFPFQEVDSFLLEKPHFPPIEIKEVNPCGSPAQIEFELNILDGEMGEGIESIMGNLEMENDDDREPVVDNSFCIGYPVGMGYHQYGMRRESRAMSTVNVIDLAQVCSGNNNNNNNKRKKLDKEMGINNTHNSVPQPNAGLLLKLNYDAILHAWSDKASPFSDDSPHAGNDVRARLAQIDLFWENGGVREASVQRYKEKRRNRLFSKKIRYQVRKVNADRRPRMKGRFVRTPDLEMQ